MCESRLPEIRKANIDDAQDVFEWRNDVFARHMSKSTGLITWDSHRDWFTSSLASKKRLLLICEDAKSENKIAIVRFDIEEHSALVSINLAPDMRGKGKSKNCLKAAISYFKCFDGAKKVINAEIKPKNKRSKKLFRAVGFVLVKKNPDMLHYQYIL